MKIAFPPPVRARAIGLGLLVACAAAGLAFAQEPAAVAAAAAAAPPAPVPNKGDTAWMLISTALVLMMSVPGLALFYGGLVRTKNMASVLSQVFMIVALVSIIWVVYGYSLAFTEGSHAALPFLGTNLNAFYGGLDRAFLKGMDASSTSATFSNGVVIPEFAYMAFQMTFACITPALIIGSFAERIKFSALLVFIVLWVTFIYFPIAHAVWYWAGPDAIAEAAKALAAAKDDAAKATAQAALDAVNANAGYFFQLGALDFAGGTVVHINAGIAGFVGCLVMGKRIGFPREVGPPHSVTMSMIGASLLWVGWFGFNAGSNLEFERHDGARLRQHLRRHLGGNPLVDVRRMGAEGQTLAARHDLGRRRRPCRRHARLRLRRTDGICCARPRGRRDLLLLRRLCEEMGRL